MTGDRLGLSWLSESVFGRDPPPAEAMMSFEEQFIGDTYGREDIPPQSVSPSSTLKGFHDCYLPRIRPNYGYTGLSLA